MKIKDIEQNKVYKTLNSSKDNFVKSGSVVWMADDGTVYIPYITGDGKPCGNKIFPDYVEGLLDGVEVEPYDDYTVQLGDYSDAAGIVVKLEREPDNEENRAD